MEDITAPPRLPQGAASRVQGLITGIQGDPASAGTATTRASNGLLADSQQFNAQVGGYRPASVLTPIMKNPGGLGMSAADASRRLADGTFLGTGNGMSESSFEPAAMLRLSGLDSE